MSNIDELYKKIRTLENISNIKSDEDEAYLLSLALVDIEESANEIISSLRKILNSNDKDDIIDNLVSMGEDLRHIIYHVKHSKFYDYIMIDDFSETI